MAKESDNKLTSVAGLSGKIGLELAFAEPGKDNGLLPINCLLAELEELIAGGTAPAEITRAVQQARAWVDAVLNATALFDSVTLERLNQWADWMQSACAALAAGQTAAPLPAAWSEQIQMDAPVATAVDASKPVEPATEIPLEMNIDQDGDLLREFANESHEHLQNIELGVLKLEEDPQDAETLNSIFRAFHTFKGGSGLLNLVPVKNLAHELESLLDLARQHKLTIDSEVINVILDGGDVLKQFVTEIEAQLSGVKPRGQALIPTQELIILVRSYTQSTGQRLAVDRGVANASAAKNASPSDGPATATHGATTATGPNGGRGRQHSGAASSVKVDTQKLDSLVDLIGEMVIAQAQVVQDRNVQSIQSQHLARNLAQLRRITNELQRTGMSLRMVPIRATFQKMVRLVRDLAAKEGKQIELKMFGEDTELDRTIVEQLNDPLVHMVRNSVDHGIEKPDIRKAKGKPEQGLVTLRAFHQGGNIVIQVQDDGAGMSKDRILAKAVEKGLVTKDHQLSEKEIFDLIFAAGFSTAEKVTELSGRGVGMDVVRRNIEALRGKVEIQSIEGRGSTFTIHLPLTLAIIDGLIVGVGEQRYILPTLDVRESFRPKAAMLSTVQERGEVINVRGHLSPLLRLYDHFQVEPRTTDPTEGVVVVVGTERENRCLLVDQLLGKQEVVIKGMGETFQQARGLAGAAILGDGSVGLILDVNAFVRLKSATPSKS
jgi:two-component system, chemotaxis family, sensor kinase CheA